MLGVAILAVVLLFGGAGAPIRAASACDRPTLAASTSLTAARGPGTIGPAHVGSALEQRRLAGPRGAYTTAQPQERMIHNLEHGGIVIWYQPALIKAADLTALTQFVQQQITTERFKMILVPWAGADFGHPIAVTAWNWLLYLDTADLDKVRAFSDAHYGQAPEPFGGPAQPGT